MVDRFRWKVVDPLTQVAHFGDYRVIKTVSYAMFTPIWTAKVYHDNSLETSIHLVCDDEDELGFLISSYLSKNA